MSLPPIFLTAHKRYTQWTLHRHVHTRLSKQPGCSDVRYAPSRTRRRFVRATVDPATFLGREYATDEAMLEVRFWNLGGQGDDCYRINWVESSHNLMMGFHRDEDHPELGACHIQLDHSNRTIDRREVTHLDAHPLDVFDSRLQQLPDALARIEWCDGIPRLCGDER